MKNEDYEEQGEMPPDYPEIEDTGEEEFNYYEEQGEMPPDYPESEDELKKEFNLSERIKVIGFLSENEQRCLKVEDVKEFIKRNIGCGIDIGGIPCGDNIGKEDGWKTYYCERCNKLKKDAGEKLI